MQKPREPSSRELEFARDQARRRERARKASPGEADYKREFGDKFKVTKRNADGTIEAHLEGNGAADYARFVAMRDGWRKEEIERGQAMQAEIPAEQVRLPDGRTVLHPVMTSRKKHDKGRVRVRVHWGRPSYRKSESDYRRELRGEK